MAKKRNSVSQLISNLKRLIPYLGVLFVFAGIIGLVLVQDPLETSQDTRSDADEREYLANLKTSVSQNFVVDKTGQISIELDSGGYTVDEVTVYFLLEHPLLDSPEVSIPQTSGFKADSIEVESVDGGYLVRVIAIPDNVAWFVPPADTTFIYVDAIAHSAEPLYLSFDAEKSYVSTPSLEILLGVPTRQEITVSDSDETSEEDACAAGRGTWKTFPNSCVDSCEKAADPDGIMCLQALTDGCDCGPSQCWNGENCVNNPGDDPGSDEVAQCNELCETNADCEVGLRCFDIGEESRCRLATNTSSDTCQAAIGGIDEPDLASCNEYCTSNAECEAGYSCYENYCRNPRNPQDNQCADPSEEQAAATISGCGESCQSNADCAINLRCFTGECRLATNVSSTTCTPATYQTISNEYDTSTDSASTTQDTKTEREKGAEMIPITDKTVTPVEDRTAPKKVYEDTYDANETIFDLVRDMATNEESRLPFFVILLGILLLVGSGIFFLLRTFQDKNRQRHLYKSKKDDGKISIESHNVNPGDKPVMPPVNNRSTIPQGTKQELLKRIKEK